MGKTYFHDLLLRRLREAVNNAYDEDKEALQEILEIAEENIDKLKEEDIFSLLKDIDGYEGIEYPNTGITLD